MAASNHWVSDLPGIYNLINNAMISYPKDAIVSMLKDAFSKDSMYHYVADSFGFSSRESMENLSPEAGLHDNNMTLVHIGETFSMNQFMYPCILVRHGGVRWRPLDLSNNRFVTHYKEVIFSDGYSSKTIFRPDYFSMAGLYDSSFIISVQAESIRVRDDLIELVVQLLGEIQWRGLSRAGVSIKPTISVSGASESDYLNGKVHSSDVTIEVLGQWERHIPVYDFIDQINLCVEFGQVSNNQATDPNFDIHEMINLENTLKDFI